MEVKVHTPNLGMQFTNRKNSIFLAGPTLRAQSEKCGSWREEALTILKRWQNPVIDVTLFIPEPFENDKRVFPPFTDDEFVGQVTWEDRYLHTAKVILFWIPRDPHLLPGFTTNVEFGEWMKSGKVVLGYPGFAPKMKYIHHKADRYHIPVFHTLEDTLRGALEML